MREDVSAMESGDRDDFKYGDDLAYPRVKVDRILRDGDTVKMGDVADGLSHAGVADLGCECRRRGETYVVAFPDGAGVNPGYRLVKSPSYPGIADDYRNTHHKLEMLKPDI